MFYVSNYWSVSKKKKKVIFSCMNYKTYIVVFALIKFELSLLKY